MWMHACVRLWVWHALTNIIFIDESMAVQIIYYYLLYGISHGFDITHELLVITGHFKDILRLYIIMFFYR